MRAELVDGLRRTPDGVLLEEGGGLAHVALARSQEATQRFLPILTRWRNESDAVLVELRGKRRNALRLLRTLAHLERGRSHHAANLRVRTRTLLQALTKLDPDANTARRPSPARAR